MEKLSNIHPGEILLEEFLKPLKHNCLQVIKGHWDTTDQDF